MAWIITADKKPDEGQRVWVGTSYKPLVPKKAVYTKGMFIDAEDGLSLSRPLVWEPIQNDV